MFSISNLPLNVQLQGRPGEKGEPGLTVSKVIDSNDTVEFYIFTDLISNPFFSSTQREEVIRIIREICGKSIFCQVLHQ